MAHGRTICLVLLSLCLMGPAYAAPPAIAAPSLDAPWPEPDPQAWWTESRPKPAEAADPLGGRRGGRLDATAGLDVDPLLYRLWGLPTLQSQVLRSGELILEVWVRPSLSVRQSVARVTVRSDGAAFVQARAGLGCCTPEIGRRVGFDARLEAGAARGLAELARDPLWQAPRDVRVADGGGAVDAVCVNGSSYDLILLTPDRARHVRRACDLAEVGQAATVLQAVLGAAIGHEPRFDVIFPGGVDFAPARRAYDQLVVGGGELKAARDARPAHEAALPVN